MHAHNIDATWNRLAFYNGRDIYIFKKTNQHIVSYAYPTPQNIIILCVQFIRFGLVFSLHVVSQRISIIAFHCDTVGLQFIYAY